MSALLDVQLADAPERGYAHEWIPLTVSLHRPADSRSSAVVKNVSCLDRDVQLDTDLLATDVPIGPGEVYQLRLRLKVARPTTVALERINIQAADGDRDELVDLPRHSLAVLPSIAREIAVKVEPLCSYESGTKVDLTIKNVGAVQFSELTITLGPESRIQAGKRVIRWGRFNPNQEEHVEVVIAGADFELIMAAAVGGIATEARTVLAVGRVPGRGDRPRFRFLEPRRLSADQKAMYQICGEENRVVEPVRAAFPLQGGEKYLLVITPPDAAVTDVQLEEIKGVVNVRTKERGADKRSWRFLLDVTATDLFSKPERLFYTVTRADETLKGEVHLRLQPPRGRYLRLAGALGVAVTLQGIGTLFKFLAKAEYSMEEAVSHFHFGSDYQLLFPVCIPLLWWAFLAYDWLQYRLQD